LEGAADAREAEYSVMCPNGSKWRELIMLQRSIESVVVESQPLSVAESTDTIRCEHHPLLTHRWNE
jgi:hypothetical protein